MTDEFESGLTVLTVGDTNVYRQQTEDMDKSFCPPYLA